MNFLRLGLVLRKTERPVFVTNPIWHPLYHVYDKLRRLLPCTIQHVTPGFVTVTIQVGPDVYIDQPILSSKFELLSAVTHNVDHIIF